MNSPKAAAVRLTILADWEPPQGETPELQWMVTFTDLVALLLCFFVLVFSMRELQPKAWDTLTGSMEGVFSLVTDETPQPPSETPEADVVVPRKGSVLPYLQQVLAQKLAGVKDWDGWQGRYDPQRDELWYAWRKEADVAALADILQSWRNGIAFVVGANERLPEALAAVDALRAKGAVVANEVRLDSGVDAKLSGGVWMVVKGVE